MAGKEFGVYDDHSFAWAINISVLALVADRFQNSRVVAFSTLCVYAFAPISGGRWDGRVEPGPTGDYATSCVGWEEFFPLPVSRSKDSRAIGKAELRHRYALRRAPRRRAMGPSRSSNPDRHGLCFCHVATR